MSRMEDDRALVRQKLPSNTVEVEIDGLVCFVYEIKCELEQDYTLCLYFDGEFYQVRLVEPKLGKDYGAHSSHLYGDGRLCLSSTTYQGLKDLEQAYARSVLWATGFSFMRVQGNDRGGFGWGE
jgi:hypothetical protein